MLHNKNATVLADNGQQVFLACDIEEILSTYYSKDSNGNSFYSESEILEMYDISKRELDGMVYLLTYEYNHDADGNYKYASSNE